MRKLSQPQLTAMVAIHFHGVAEGSTTRTVDSLRNNGLVEFVSADSDKSRLTLAGRDAYFKATGEVLLDTETAESEDDPIVAVQMNRKDRRDEGRAKRRLSRRVAKVRDQRQKKWGGQVTINLQHLAA